MTRQISELEEALSKSADYEWLRKRYMPAYDASWQGKFRGYKNILPDLLIIDSAIWLMGPFKIPSSDVFGYLRRIPEGSNPGDLEYPKFDLLILKEEKESDKKKSLLILNDGLSVKSIIKDIYTNNANVFKIKPREFEKVIAELYEAKGFSVELTKQTRDGGRDIIAIQDLVGLKNKYLIECKRHSSNRPVGIQIVRGFMDVIAEHNANKGIICTTSYFTKDVYKRQSQVTAYRLELHDRIQLLEWVDDYIKNARPHLIL